MSGPMLDGRLQAAFDLFPPCRRGADIGCDHGLLSHRLLRDNKCETMVVTDISEPSLTKAKALLARDGLDTRASFFAADGLAPLDDEVSAMAILGMGGETIAGILDKGRDKLRGAALVLCPHTKQAFLRGFLPTIGYAIDREVIAFAEGRYYVLIRALPGKARYSEKECFLGPDLILRKPTLYKEYLESLLSREERALSALRDAGGDMRRGEVLEKRVGYIREELS